VAALGSIRPSMSFASLLYHGPSRWINNVPKSAHGEASRPTKIRRFYIEHVELADLLGNTNEKGIEGSGYQTVHGSSDAGSVDCFEAGQPTLGGAPIQSATRRNGIRTNDGGAYTALGFMYSIASLLGLPCEAA